MPCLMQATKHNLSSACISTYIATKQPHLHVVSMARLSMSQMGTTMLEWELLPNTPYGTPSTQSATPCSVTSHEWVKSRARSAATCLVSSSASSSSSSSSLSPSPELHPAAGTPRQGFHSFFVSLRPDFYLYSLGTGVLQMLQGSSISNQKTLYEVLSVREDATYDEIRAAYKGAALNTHPDKAQAIPESFVSTGEQQGFFGVQKAWETLRHPKCRAEYDKQLQSSRQSLDIIASDIEIEDMIVESCDDGVELSYACRCGDYFSITSCELGEMGISVSEDVEIEARAPDSLPTSVVMGCGSCSLKTRLVINKA